MDLETFGPLVVPLLCSWHYNPGLQVDSLYSPSSSRVGGDQLVQSPAILAVTCPLLSNPGNWTYLGQRPGTSSDYVYLFFQTTKRSIPMLFVRGDGVILISPPLRVGVWLTVWWFVLKVSQNLFFPCFFALQNFVLHQHNNWTTIYCTNEVRE